MKEYINPKQFLKTVVLFITVSTLCCCNKDNNDCQGIDCLPAATQTGAGTFGCLVNGEPYVDNSGNFNCFYQFVDGEYYFSISPNFQGKLFGNLGIGCRNVNFSNNQFFDLAIGNISGGAATFSVANELRDISTNLDYNGICQISNFNLTNNTISGTFEFEIFDDITQTLYVITDGRFDATFTE